MKEGIPDSALRQFHEKFVNSPYIGRAQLWDKEETGLGPHRFFYLGYYDIFGVEMPCAGRRKGVEFQIWPLAWVKRRLKKLDKHIEDAMAGDYLQVRHNIQLQKRAKKHGRKLHRKPTWHRKPKAEAALKEGNKLPKRKRKRRRLRVKLKV